MIVSVKRKSTGFCWFAELARALSRTNTCTSPARRLNEPGRFGRGRSLNRKNLVPGNDAISQLIYGRVHSERTQGFAADPVYGRAKCLPMLGAFKS